MLDAKWSIDKKRGDGFKIGDDVKMELFDEINISGYLDKVLKLLLNSSNETNHSLLDFGLEHNFLPKHTKTVLDGLKRDYKIELNSLDGKPAVSYYLGNDERLVNIKLIKK